MAKQVKVREPSSQLENDKRLEEKVDAIIETMEKARIETQKNVEEKVDKLMETVEKQKKMDGHEVLDRVDAVRMKLQEGK